MPVSFTLPGITFVAGYEQENIPFAEFNLEITAVPHGKLADPIADGIVGSYASPSGNFTGFVSFSAAIAGKWLQLLKEVAPSATQIGVLYNPDTAPHAIFLPIMDAIAPSLGMNLVRMPVQDKEAIESAVGGLSPASGGAPKPRRKKGKKKKCASIISPSP